MFRQPSIKFLADESTERGIISFLRSSGFDIYSISEEKPRLIDPDVLEIAFQQKRVLITNDKGFSNLVFKDKQPSYGVILMRLPKDYTEQKILRLKEIIGTKDLNKIFITITPKQTRSKLLPIV